MAKTDPKVKAELEVLQRCKEHLEKGKNIRELELDKDEKAAIADLFLLTDKPVFMLPMLMKPPCIPAINFLNC